MTTEIVPRLSLWQRFVIVLYAIRNRARLFLRGDAYIKRVLRDTTAQLVIHRGAFERIIKLANSSSIHVVSQHKGSAVPYVLIEAHAFVNLLEEVYGPEHPYVRAYLESVMDAKMKDMQKSLPEATNEPSTEPKVKSATAESVEDGFEPMRIGMPRDWD